MKPKFQSGDTAVIIGVLLYQMNFTSHLKFCSSKHKTHFG